MARAALLPAASPRRTLSQDLPACAPSPKACVALALDAMGGRERLEGVKTISLEGIQHTQLVEQSYRQEPFITAYARTKEKLDFGAQRALIQTHLTWPESDPGQAESDTTLVVGPEGGVSTAPRSPIVRDRAAGVDEARYALAALGPMRLLLTALSAPDLHFESPQRLRGSVHPVLGFSWQGRPMRVMINPFKHLPDALERVAVFRDHWYQWGDVRQRIYWDNWQTFHGIRYPTNEVEERNGIAWESRQVLGIELNPSIDAADFKMDAQVAAKVSQSKGWESPFKAKDGVTLAPGVTLFPGAWNATVVKQDDGIVLLESPLSGTYFGGVIDKAKADSPGQPVKAVLSTSDSWPHVGGVRQAVALGLPLYEPLDLNQPLLERLVASPRHIHPDLLGRARRMRLDGRWCPAKCKSGRARIAWNCTHCAVPARNASTWCISPSTDCSMPATPSRSMPMDLYTHRN